MVREINVQNGVVAVRLYTAKELSDQQVIRDNVALQELTRTKTLSLDAIERLLLKAGISKSDIDAEKR